MTGGASWITGVMVPLSGGVVKGEGFLLLDTELGCPTRRDALVPSRGKGVSLLPICGLLARFTSGAAVPLDTFICPAPSANVCGFKKGSRLLRGDVPVFPNNCCFCGDAGRLGMRKGAEDVRTGDVVLSPIGFRGPWLKPNMTGRSGLRGGEVGEVTLTCGGCG